MPSLSNAKQVGKVLSGRIKVVNLHWITSEEQLRAHFSQFGKVDSVHIPTRPNGFHNSFGFVNFKNAKDAKALLESKTAHYLDERSIRIEKDRKQ